MDDESDLKVKIELYQSIILKLAITYMKNAECAKDIVREVFITYYKNLPTFKTLEHEKDWFLRVTINKCKNERRKNSINGFRWMKI